MSRRQVLVLNGDSVNYSDCMLTLTSIKHPAPSSLSLVIKSCNIPSLRISHYMISNQEDFAPVSNTRIKSGNLSSKESFEQLFCLDQIREALQL